MNIQLIATTTSADQSFYVFLTIILSIGCLVYIYIIRPQRQAEGKGILAKHLLADPDKIKENMKILNVLSDSSFLDLASVCNKMVQRLDGKMWNSKKSMEVLKAVLELGNERKLKKTSQREYRGNPSEVVAVYINHLNNLISASSSALDSAANKGLDFGIITTSTANLAAYQTVDALERRKNVTTASYNIHVDVETCLVTMIEQLRTECYIPGAGPALLPQKTIGNDDVTSSDCSEKEIIVSPGIYRIDASTFKDHNQLTSVTLPEGITVIDEDAFSKATRLTSVTLPNSIHTIGNWAFYECTGLTSITLPEGLYEIGSNAFGGCTGLTSIKLPNSLKKIGSNAFDRCTGLTSITLPDGLREICGNAFRGCTGLKSITLPEGLQEIGGNAFSGCTGLTSITLPNSLKEIGDEAFCGCTQLTSITLPEVLPRFGKKVFADTGSLCKINYNGNKQYIIKDFFGNTIPKGLIPQIAELHPHMTAYAIKQYILRADIWETLDQNLQTEIFFSHHEKILMPQYAEVVDNDLVFHLGAVLCDILKQTPSEKNCELAVSYLLTFKEIAGDEQKENVYSLLKTCKYGAKALQAIEEANNT